MIDTIGLWMFNVGAVVFLMVTGLAGFFGDSLSEQAKDKIGPPLIVVMFGSATLMIVGFFMAFK